MLDLNFDTTLPDPLNAILVHKMALIVLMVLAVILIVIFLVTDADSASAIMERLSENSVTDPSRFTVVLRGMTTGGVTSVTLLADGDDLREVFTGLRDTTIVSALPFVFVMLLPRVLLYKDLNNDPMLLRHSLTNQALVDSATTAVTMANEPHEAEAIELYTSLSLTTGVGDADDAAGEGCQDGTDEATQDPSADIRAADDAEGALRGSKRRLEG